MNYLLVSSIVLLALGFIWNKANILNLLIRILLLGVGLWGLIEFAISKGYMFKTGM